MVLLLAFSCPFGVRAGNQYPILSFCPSAASPSSTANRASFSHCCREISSPSHLTLTNVFTSSVWQPTTADRIWAIDYMVTKLIGTGTPRLGYSDKIAAAETLLCDDAVLSDQSAYQTAKYVQF